MTQFYVWYPHTTPGWSRPARGGPVHPGVQTSDCVTVAALVFCALLPLADAVQLASRGDSTRKPRTSDEFLRIACSAPGAPFTTRKPQTAITPDEFHPAMTSLEYGWIPLDVGVQVISLAVAQKPPPPVPVSAGSLQVTKSLVYDGEMVM